MYHVIAVVGVEGATRKECVAVGEALLPAIASHPSVVRPSVDFSPKLRQLMIQFECGQPDLPWSTIDEASKALAEVIAAAEPRLSLVALQFLVTGSAIAPEFGPAPGAALF